MLQRMQPSPIGLRYSGSFLLEWQPGPRNYLGTWSDGADGYALTFVYDTATGQTTTFANFDVGGDRAWLWYASKVIPLPPNLLYETYEIIPSFFLWRTALTITG